MSKNTNVTDLQNAVYAKGGQPGKPTDDQVKKIAKEFAKRLYKYNGNKKMAIVNKKNKTSEYELTGSCASHDFCDANVVMLDAFEKVLNRKIVWFNDEIPATEKQNEIDTNTMNIAWSMAKDADFYNGKFEDGGKPLSSTGLFAAGGKASVELPGTNLWLSGFGMDTNGNSIVRVGFPNDRAFSIQTNGTLPETNRIQKSSPRLADLTDKQLKEISKEVSEYVRDFGSLNQKTRLKKYSFFAKGGKTMRTKNGIAADKTIKALHPGKRTSASGETYWEGRANRSDVNRTKKFDEGGQPGEWFGTDADLETSLHEYGFVMRSLKGKKDMADDEYGILFKVGDQGYDYSFITVSHMDAIVNGEEWADEDDVQGFLDSMGHGESKQDWLELSPQNKLGDLLSYWGYENVIGSSYSVMTKKEADEMIGIVDTSGDDLIEFTIPTWAISAIVNGDFSGLRDDEEEKLKKFLDRLSEEYGNANLMTTDEGAYFTHGNDIYRNMGGDVEKMVLLPSKEYSEGGKPLGSTGLFAKGGKITEEDFYEKYQPIINHIVRKQTDKSVADEDITSYSGCMYETYGPELEYIESLNNDPKKKNTVWTIVEGDDDENHVIAGFHVVNRFGYLVTKNPWKTGKESVANDDFAEGGKPLGSTGLFAKGGKLIHWKKNGFEVRAAVTQGEEGKILATGNTIKQVIDVANEARISGKYWSVWINTPNTSLGFTENNTWKALYAEGGKPLGSTGLFGSGGSMDKEHVLPEGYYKTFSMPGNRNRQYNIFQSHGDSAERRANKILFPDYTYQQHVDAANKYEKKFLQTYENYKNLLDELSVKEFGRKLEASDYKVSGIYRDDFSNEAKDKIRSELNKITQYSAAVRLHNSILKKADKVINLMEEGGKPLGSTGLFAKGGYFNTYKVGDVVYNKKHNTVGIVRHAELYGELQTDADGNVPVTDLQHYNPKKHKGAHIAPSTKKEMKSFASGGSVSDTPKIYVADLAAYNEGALVGEWLDLTDYSSGEEVVAAIHELLKEWSKEAGVEREEYAIHDTENLPKEFHDEYLGVKDFDKFYEYQEVAKEIGVPFEVVADWVNDTSTDVSSASSAYVGQYDDMEDYAYQMVQEGVLSVGNNIYITDTDRRIISQEEADNRYDYIDDEDELIKDADLTDELDELETKQSEKEDIESEIETAEEEEVELNNELDALNEELDAAETKKEITALKNKIDKKNSEISEKEDEILEIESRGNEYDGWDFDTAKTELADKAREQLKDSYSDEVYNGLEDPIQHFVNEHGIYSEEDLVKQSFIRVDYEQLAKELGYDYTEIIHDGSSYIFNNNFAKGGKLKTPKAKKDYSTIEKGSTVTINSEELKKHSVSAKSKKDQQWCSSMIKNANGVGKVENVGRELIKVKFSNSTVTAPRKYFVRLAYKYGGNIK